MTPGGSSSRSASLAAPYVRASFTREPFASTSSTQSATGSTWAACGSECRAQVGGGRDRCGDAEGRNGEGDAALEAGSRVNRADGVAQATAGGELYRDVSEAFESFARQLDRGIRSRKRAAMRGSHAICRPSAMASVKVRVQLSASKAPGATARGVGTMPRPHRVTSGSPNADRSRASALLIADGVTCSRFAARATLCSLSTVSSTRSRLRSTVSILTTSDFIPHES